MAWHDRPEGFIAKSFDHKAPASDERFSSVIETPNNIFGIGQDGWDADILVKNDGTTVVLDALQQQAMRDYYAEREDDSSSERTWDA